MKFPSTLNPEPKLYLDITWSKILLLPKTWTPLVKECSIIRYSKNLFEPIIFAERFIGEKKWNCISNIFTEEEKEDIISRLDDK